MKSSRRCPRANKTQEAERIRLVTAVPELRARMLAQFSEMIQMLAEAVAERVGRQPDDFEVRTFAGALVGVALGVAAGFGEDRGDYLEQFIVPSPCSRQDCRSDHLRARRVARASRSPTQAVSLLAIRFFRRE